MSLTATDRRWIEDRALAAGFHLAGLTAVPAPSSQSAQLSASRFSDWIAAGHAGEMDWLKRTDPAGQLLRSDLRLAIPWARSVLVCALDYTTAAPLSTQPAAAAAGWIARYAWSGQPSPDSQGQGSDYHDVLLPRLRAVESDLHARFGPALTTRPYVDTGPIVERDFAAHAGIGWIGKNTCVLSTERGSWLLLGVIITSLELASDAQPLPAPDRCGTCTRCIDACPTNALIAPRQMNASRCISYLTIEKKGSIPADLRPLMGRQVFGCDICQDVCPWNARASRHIPPQSLTAPHPSVSEASLQKTDFSGSLALTSQPPAPEPEAHPAPLNPLPPRRELINPALDWLASLDGPAFNRWFRGSSLERTGRKRILRNVAIAMGNSGLRRFLPQLEDWSTSDDPILAEAAAWAAARLRSAPADSHPSAIAPLSTAK